MVRRALPDRGVVRLRRDSSRRGEGSAFHVKRFARCARMRVCVERSVYTGDTYMRQGIYGHTSEDTAYMIADYPYGRTERCRRRVWLESSKFGIRFVSQTEHPRSKVWNKPHKSTYVDVAACMYLDENGHVQWSGVSKYTDHDAALAFVQDFGKNAVGAKDLHAWAVIKATVDRKLSSGEAYFTLNGVKQERSETERERDANDAKAWERVAALLA